MSDGIKLEVWFPQQNEVSVFLESTYSEPDEEQFYETCLLALYAARQVANLGSGGASLAYVLQQSTPRNRWNRRSSALTGSALPRRVGAVAAGARVLRASYVPTSVRSSSSTHTASG